jgi:hypothetical protein
MSHGEQACQQLPVTPAATLRVGMFNDSRNNFATRPSARVNLGDL